MATTAEQEVGFAWKEQGPSPRFVTVLANSQAQVREAQRLRYRVFAEEMGATIHHCATSLDSDRFDQFCEHLLVCDADSGELVGTYRILTADRARHTGGFYSDTEFDLGALRTLGNPIEVGRACVHSQYRNGTVITQLWAGLFRYVLAAGYTHVMGCGSIPLGGGAAAAASLCSLLEREFLSPAGLRVTPHKPFPLDEFEGAPSAEPPPLIKGYLRLGAWVCGDPAWDPDFNTADLFILLPMDRLNPRYAARLMRQS